MKFFGHKERTQEATQAPGFAVPKIRKPKISISTIVMFTMLFLGAGIMAYPTFSDWWNSYHQSRAIATYASRVEETDPAVLEALLADAQEYNRRLQLEPNRYVFSDEEKIQYDKLLDLTGDGIMGYIQVQRLGINYPIYHSTDEKYLQIAIGHIEGTSLPVGGSGVHAAVSGHRGLPRAKLFSDLDKMTEGDIFTITVLNETLTYEVDQIRIVEPTDMSDLNIDPDKDYVTLVTCTPYGINTHRLLVRGHRVENLAGTVVVPAGAVQIPNYIAVPAVALPMLFVYLAGTLIYYRVHRDGYDHERVMQALSELKDAPAEGEVPDEET